MRVRAAWTAPALGLPAHATFRAFARLPGLGLAVGADYGMVVRHAGDFHSFPFPEGARREARRVEAMVAFEGELYVGSQVNRYRWRLHPPPFVEEARGRSLPRDQHNVVDDLRALFVLDGRLVTGWRTRLDGAEGPPEVTSFAQGAQGAFAGSLDGSLWRLGAGPLRRFVDAGGRPAPVRYLAWAHGRLWVAADGALHTWDGAAWASRPGEPYFLHALPDGRLLSLRQGGLWISGDGAWPRRSPIRLTRPWALGDSDEGIWVGEVGRLTLLAG